MTQVVTGRENVSLVSSELAWRPKEAVELEDEEIETMKKCRTRWIEGYC